MAFFLSLSCDKRPSSFHTLLIKKPALIALYLYWIYLVGLPTPNVSPMNLVDWRCYKIGVLHGSGYTTLEFDILRDKPNLKQKKINFYFNAPIEKLSKFLSLIWILYLYRKLMPKYLFIFKYSFLIWNF